MQKVARFKIAILYIAGLSYCFGSVEEKLGTESMYPRPTQRLTKPVSVIPNSNVIKHKIDLQNWHYILKQQRDVIIKLRTDISDIQNLMKTKLMYEEQIRQLEELGRQKQHYFESTRLIPSRQAYKERKSLLLKQLHELQTKQGIIPAAMDIMPVPQEAIKATQPAIPQLPTKSQSEELIRSDAKKLMVDHPITLKKIAAEQPLRPLDTYVMKLVGKTRNRVIPTPFAQPATTVTEQHPIQLDMDKIMQPVETQPITTLYPRDEEIILSQRLQTQEREAIRAEVINLGMNHPQMTPAHFSPGPRKNVDAGRDHNISDETLPSSPREQAHENGSLHASGLNSNMNHPQMTPVHFSPDQREDVKSIRDQNIFDEQVPSSPHKQTREKKLYSKHSFERRQLASLYDNFKQPAAVTIETPQKSISFSTPEMLRSSSQFQQKQNDDHATNFYNEETTRSDSSNKENRASADEKLAPAVTVLSSTAFSFKEGILENVHPEQESSILINDTSNNPVVKILNTHAALPSEPSQPMTQQDTVLTSSNEALQSTLLPEDTGFWASSSRMRNLNAQPSLMNIIPPQSVSYVGSGLPLLPFDISLKSLSFDPVSNVKSYARRSQEVVDSFYNNLFFNQFFPGSTHYGASHPFKKSMQEYIPLASITFLKTQQAARPSGELGFTGNGHFNISPEQFKVIANTNLMLLIISSVAEFISTLIFNMVHFLNQNIFISASADR